MKRNQLQTSGSKRGQYFEDTMQELEDIIEEMYN
jgi:exonuclease VII small subunit